MRLYNKYKKLLLGIIILALPAIGETSLNTLLGMADTLMISHFIGKNALAGVGFANQIVMSIIFVFTSFNIGATALISRNYGKKDYDRLNKIAGQTLVINGVIGFIVTSLGMIFKRQIFSLYDLSPEVLEIAISYFTIVIFSGVFMFLSFSFAAILRGSGDTKTPMYITAVANVINIIGNFVLITGFGPFPQLGAIGAAISTTVSRGIATMIYTYILFIKNRDKKVKVKKENLRITKEIALPLWKVSYPGAIEQLLMQTSFLVAGIIITSLDTNSESAFRILISIESLSFMPAVGLSIATATLVGKALGEKDADKALSTGYGSTVLGIAWGIIIGSIFLLFPEFLLRIFTSDEGVIAASMVTMVWAGFNQSVLNPVIILSGALRGAGDTKGVMIIAALRIWLIFIPLTYLCIRYLGYGVEGLWMGEIISLLIGFIALFMRFHAKKWLTIRFDHS